VQSRSGSVAYSPMLDGSCRYTSPLGSIFVPALSHIHILFLCLEVDQFLAMWKKSDIKKIREDGYRFLEKGSNCNLNFLKFLLEFVRVYFKFNIIERENVFAWIWEMSGRYDYLTDITWLHFLPPSLPLDRST